jgi:DNA polymerase elongation subunit (family B)
MNRLFWDIETSPNLVWSFDVGRKRYIHQQNIEEERAILCICYKWEGESRVHSLTWDAENKCDKEMITKFIEVSQIADELVAHNGDHFDLKYFNGRALVHGIVHKGNFTTVDTLKIARKYFKLNSNSLDYLSKLLLGSKKINTSFDLWRDTTLGCPKALSKMVKYCKKDVILLQKVYEKLSEYAPASTHAGVLKGNDRWSCPKCGSESVYSNGSRVRASGIRQHMFKCKNCYAQYTISEGVARKYFEFKSFQKNKSLS